MKKLVKMLTMILVLSLVIGVAGTACAENIEMHYAYWQSTLDDFYAQCKADFEAAQSGVTIVLEPTAWC